MNRENTIRKNWYFQKIIKNGKQIINKHLVIYYLDSKENLKCGISISKKFTGAVGRNKYRRQVRSILDNINLWDKKQKEVVIILRKPFLTLPFIEMEKTIRKTMEKL